MAQLNIHMSQVELLLIDASLNDLIADRCASLALTCSVAPADGEPQILTIRADSEDPNLAVLMAEFGNELAVI